MPSCIMAKAGRPPPPGSCVGRRVRATAQALSLHTSLGSGFRWMVRLPPLGGRVGRWAVAQFSTTEARFLSV